MRGLIILKTGEPIVVDYNPHFDAVDNQYHGSLAVGGSIVIPRENVNYYKGYPDSQIENFRYELQRAEDAYHERKRESIHSESNS